MNYKSLLVLFYGILMGTANKIPGVSGGLVAIAIGFYEKLVFSLKKFDKTAFKKIINFRFNDFFKYVNGSFLSLIFLGIIISYFSTSKILEIFLDKYEIYVWSLFFGLVIGTIFHLKKLVNFKSNKNLLFVFVGVSVGFIISLLDPANENDNLIFVFLCGIISVSGMILPGLSGSFILMLMGNYVLLLVDSVNALYDSLNEIVSGNYENFSNPERINYLKVLSVFTLGSFTGLITLSNILGYLLKKYNELCNAIIFGFIIGSLGVIWPWKMEFNYENSEKIIRYMPSLNSNTIFAILFILIGVSSVILISKYERK